MPQMLNGTDRFDGASHWASLSEEDKASIGAATLEQIASEYMADRAFDDNRPVWDRIAGAAEQSCRAVVKDIFVETIDREALETPEGQPRIPSLLGMVCEGCGCSGEDACAEGCGWAGKSRCTACAALCAEHEPTAGEHPCP